MESHTLRRSKGAEAGINLDCSLGKGVTLALSYDKDYYEYSGTWLPMTALDQEFTLPHADSNVLTKNVWQMVAVLEKHAVKIQTLGSKKWGREVKVYHLPAISYTLAPSNNVLSTLCKKELKEPPLRQELVEYNIFFPVVGSKHREKSWSDVNRKIYKIKDSRYGGSKVNIRAKTQRAFEWFIKED